MPKTSVRIFISLNTNPLLGRATFTPGITSIDVYLVDALGSTSSWVYEAWLQSGDCCNPETS